MLPSVYTILKTTFWLGGRSFFRAPKVLVVAYFLLLIGLLVCARRRTAVNVANAWLPQIAGAAVALAGVVTFVLANRRFFAGWGGVGGWYVWGWAPWLLVAFDDLAEIPQRAARALMASMAVFVVAANILYFDAAIRLYS